MQRTTFNEWSICGHFSVQCRNNCNLSHCQYKRYVDCYQQKRSNKWHCISDNMKSFSMQIQPSVCHPPAPQGPGFFSGERCGNLNVSCSTLACVLVFVGEVGRHRIPCCIICIHLAKRWCMLFDCAAALLGCSFVLCPSVLLITARAAKHFMITDFLPLLTVLHDECKSEASHTTTGGLLSLFVCSRLGAFQSA